MALFLVVFLLVGLEKTENIYVRPITIASGNESSKSMLCSFSITTQRVSQQIMPTTNFILNIRETNSVRVFTNPAYDAQRRTTSGLYKLKYTFVLSPKNNPKNRPAHNSQKIDQIRPFKNCAFVVQFCWNHSEMNERPDYSKIGANKTRKTYNKTMLNNNLPPTPYPTAPKSASHSCRRPTRLPYSRTTADDQWNDCMPKKWLMIKVDK